jgi:uncharacterized membrane protein YgcG
VERVRKAKANTLRREFDTLKFRDDETLDDFHIRLNKITLELVILNDGCTTEELVWKLLQALPERYHRVAISINMLLDISTMSTEELMGRLKSTEQRLNLGDGSDSIAKLNLSEDELVTRVATKMNVSGGGSSRKSRGSSSSHSCGRSGRRGHGGSHGGSRPP